MADRTCSIETCDSPAQARGWCGSHYQRWRRHGDPNKVMFTRGDDQGRFWSKVDSDGDGGCWLWLAGCNSDGYGTFWLDGASDPAHRVAYQWLVGPVPEGLHLDHLCRVRRCVNPAHLEPVTCKENILRGTAPPAANARKTHCVHGHEFTPENTYEYKGWRFCRVCLRANGRRHDARRRAS